KRLPGKTDSTGKTRNLNNKPIRPKLKKLKPVAKRRQPYVNFRIIFCAMSGYASDYLNSTITLQQEETLKRPVIVKDSRHHHEIQSLPMQNNFSFGKYCKQALHLIGNRSLTRLERASYDSFGVGFPVL
ncbi:MAG: hypothetical protein WAV82_02600, partial [Methylobacter sp.]